MEDEGATAAMAFQREVVMEAVAAVAVEAGLAGSFGLRRSR
jgi:hypothetical protein